MSLELPKVRSRWTVPAVMAIATLASGSTLWAQESRPCLLQHRISWGFNRCTCESCELEIKTKKEKESCFVVEQETICIPPLTLPWCRCTPSRPPQTRKICKLGTKSSEKETTSYHWKVVEPKPAATTTSMETEFKRIPVVGGSDLPQKASGYDQTPAEGDVSMDEPPTIEFPKFDPARR